MKKKIVMVDAPVVIDNMREPFEKQGYEFIGISKAGFIEKVIQDNDAGLLILAVEMRVSGTTDDPLSNSFTEELSKSLSESEYKNTTIDFEFGWKLAYRLLGSGMKCPIIFTSTFFVKPKWVKDDGDRLVSAIIPKPQGLHDGSLEKAVAGVLER